MQTILTVLQVFLSLGLIILVLIQHGRGADAGAAFGSGASATVFGARGSGSFLTRVTAVLATLFFLTSMALAYYAAQSGKPEGLMDSVDGVHVAPAPAARVEVPAQAPAGGSEIPTVPGAVPQSQVSDVPVLGTPGANPGALVKVEPAQAAPQGQPTEASDSQAIAPAAPPAGPNAGSKDGEVAK